MFNQLLAISTAVFAISITYLLPIVAIGWGIFDGETFSKFQWLAAFLIVFGVYLGQKKAPK
jgi:drug/metabolite transporter (DMT)-like permease